MTRARNRALLSLTNSNLKGPLRIFCVGAHSDDLEIGCGATLRRLAALKPRPEFTWVVLSAAGARADEALKGARGILGAVGVEEVVLHNFRDGYFPDEYAAIKDAFEVFGRGKRPDLVFTHARQDRHQDHRLASDLTWNTFRQSTIFEYEIPKWDGDLGQPNCYVPLTSAEAAKKVATLMNVFGSQRGKDWFSEETFFGLMRLRGMECRSTSGYAEAFHGRKLILGI